MVPNLVDSSMTNPSLQNVNHGGSASFSIFYIFSKPTCQRYGWWCKDAHFDPPVIKHGNGNRPFISDFPKKNIYRYFPLPHLMIPEGTSFHLLLQIGPPGALEIAPLRVAPSPALRPLTVSCSACVCLAIVGGAVVETWGEVSCR